ncbi:TetR/AcrR family transcriptional regulator [Xylocopilactobacillus apicola]|uniref:TetR family transcriptional regulator n=1 Tax=Xylocopilactobacillus apicola TaxID=2932184 RepID=A0AAU9CVG8_9LACO|nr:TetR/AcrR family transcriptional regulator [Xylocopilactobacillus apicola]BDR57982.1 TetR family transcriptional regulator [Xylocopilactobacillus apicola]
MNGKQKIAEQSRVWLWESLLKLLKTSEYSEITITEIAQHADLTRKTFYNSFKNKDELLAYGYLKIIDNFIHEMVKIPLTERTAEHSLELFVNFWWEQKPFIQLLMRKKIYQKFMEVWQEQAINRYLDYNTTWKSNDPLENKFQASFVFGGLSNILATWLSSDEPLPPDQMMELIMKIIPK